LNLRTLCLLLATLLLSAPAVAQPKATTPPKAGAPAQVNVQAKTLRLNVPVSAGNPINENIQDFRRVVVRRTGGAVKVTLLGKGQAYEDNEVISAISSGAIEMGATSLNQFAYDVPLAGVFLQPFMFNYDALVRAAAKPGSEIRTLIDEEILYWTNARVLWWQPRGSTVIFSRRVPEFNPAAIVNKSVGAPDDLTKELTKACGGSPHLVPTSDLFGALQKENIQITMTDIFGVTERDLWRVADTIVNTKHSPSLFIVVINNKVWDDLSESQQRILSEAAAAVQDRMWDLFAKVEADAYAFAAKKGMKVYDPSPKEVVAWRECTAPLLESYVDRIGDLGPKLFAAYGRLRTDPCCNSTVPEQMPFDLR
jgi:TRAP-type C4-dicarboxylate transport system substrate-binding protein